MAESSKITLGQFLKEANHPEKESLSGVEESRLVAPFAYNPGYPSEPADGTVSDDTEARIDTEETPILDSENDLSLASKQALNKYAVDRLSSENSYHPKAGVQDALSGHARGETLDRSQTVSSHYVAQDAESSYSDDFIAQGLTDLISDKGQSSSDIVYGLRATNLMSSDSTFGKKLVADEDSDVREPFKVQELLEAKNKYTPGSSTPFVASDPGTGRGDNQLYKGLYSLFPGELGKYDLNLNDNPRPVVTVAELRKATLELLHQAQSGDSFGGKGQSSAVAQGIFDANSPFASGADALIVLPQVTQAGVGTVAINSLRMRNMRAMDSFSEIAGADDIITVESFGTSMGGGGTPDPVTKQVPINGKSYGTMNSPAEPFNGVAPFGMIMPALFALVVLMIAGLIFGAILSGFDQAEHTPLEAEDPSTLAWGLNTQRGVDPPGGGAEIAQKFLNMFGLPREWGVSWISMFEGVMSFFGIDINPMSPGAVVADLFINLMMGPGYYVVVSKRIMQDFEQIHKAFDNFSNLTNSGFGFVTIILASIEALFSSFTIKFFLLMNDLGRRGEEFRLRGGVKAHGTNIMPLRDEITARPPLYPQTRGGMGRFYPADGSRPMNPLSPLLFPAVFISTPDTNGVELLQTPPGTEHTSPKTQAVSGRLSPEQVAVYEELIDAEYMPFTIHDLRTNEIVSLPAFINNLSDDFSADYNSTHGFGRTDPVHIYTKTTRNITLGFSLVATSAKDHKYIWYLVNKFVSMVYPQRGKGRERTLKKGNGIENDMTFIQPFSQQVVASPVVRIRVGDTIASNESVSAFAKIFGGTGQLGGGTKTDPAESQAHKLALEAFGKLSKRVHARETGKLRKAMVFDGDKKPEKEIKPGKAGDGLLISKGTPVYVTVDTGNGPINVEIKTGYDIFASSLKKTGKEWGWPFKKCAYALPEDSIQLNDEIDAMAFGGKPLLAAFREAENAFPPPPFGKPPPIEVFIVNTEKDNVKISFNKDKTLTEAQALDADAIAYRKFPAPDEGDEDKKEEERKEFKTGLENDITAVKTLAPADVLSADVASFLNTNPPKDGETAFVNPVMRAFKSTQGRGLAGVIQQLGLSYDQELWGTSFDSGGQVENLRAPKKVDINITFAPIHDFPLGLNSKGEMFAPSHPVGVLSKKSMDERLLGDKTPQQIAADSKAKARSGVGMLPKTESPGKPKLPF